MDVKKFRVLVIYRRYVQATRSIGMDDDGISIGRYGSSVLGAIAGSMRQDLQAEVAGEADLSLLGATLPRMRTKETREAYLEAFAREMVPDRVDPALWESWLAGGSAPFDAPVPRRPETHKQSLSRDLDRQSKVVERSAYEVIKARQTLERAQARVADAEAALRKARADDQASLLSAVCQTLKAQLSPLFAMGPAWTILRALSSAITPEELEDELRLEKTEARRADLEKVIRQERRAETNEMLEALQAWAGDAEFEREIRDAIFRVVVSRRQSDPPRSSEDVTAFGKANVIPGDLTSTASETLDGLTR